MESTTQIFLRVQRTDDEDDFVKGEGYVEGYSDRVQIDSFSFGMKSKLQSTAPKSTKEANLDFDPVRVSKVFDRSTLSLASLLKSRKQLYEVRVTVDQQLEEVGVGKAQNAVVVFHLSQARVVDMKIDVTQGSVSAMVKEDVSFTFKNFSVEYYYKGKKNNKKSDYRDQWVGFATEYEVQE